MTAHLIYVLIYNYQVNYFYLSININKNKEGEFIMMSDNLDLFKLYLQDDNTNVSDFFKSNGKYDIIDSIINNELNQIKAMIGQELNEKKTEAIDSEFFESLKKYFIVKGKELSGEELKNLSYFYFAIYNNTVDNYYKIKATSDSIFYFMLDENVCNSINNIELDISKLNLKSKNLLQIAYDHDVFELVLEMFKLNPKFGREFTDLKEKIVALPGFKTVIDNFGVKFMAECKNYKLIYKALNNNQIDDLKKLLSLNPNLDLSYNVILDTQVRDIIPDEQLAKFSAGQLINLQQMIYIESSLFPYIRLSSSQRFELRKSILNDYVEIMNINPDFILYDNNYLLMGLIIVSDLPCPLNVLAFLDKEAQTEMYNMYAEYQYCRYNCYEPVISSVKKLNCKRKLRRLIDRETKKINTALTIGDVAEIEDGKPKLYMKK